MCLAVGGFYLNLSIDGLDINYSKKGTGDFVFLLHGWGSNLELFTKLTNVISQKYTVVSLDFPGFGLSQEPKEAWSILEYAEFLIKFIEHFHCDKVILLGHSFGGRVIIKMSSLSKLPFLIEKIILVDSAGILPKKTLKHKFKLKMYKSGKLLLSFYPIKKVFPDALNYYKKKMGSSDYSNASEIMRNVLVKTVNEDLEPFLKNISAQTLIIWGEDDTVTPLSDGQKIKQAIASSGTDVGLVVLKEAGHFSFLDQPHTFHKVIKSFLKIGE